MALGAGAAGFFFWKKPVLAKTPPRKLDVFLTCDLSGRLEPCGCFEGQYGGLSRISTLLAGASADVLRVDAGDALAGSEDYQVAQYRYVLQALGKLGFHAVNLGRREVTLPAKTLREVIKSSPTPLISANVIDAKTGAPLAVPWRIVKLGNGLRVGVVGVVDPARLGQTKIDAELRVADMLESLRKAISEVQAQSDTLICLAFTDEAGLERIARSCYEFQLILGGDVAQPSQNLLLVNQSYILATTNQARAVGTFTATIGAKGKSWREVFGEVKLVDDSIPQDSQIVALSRDYRREVRRMPLAIDQAGRDDPNAVPGVKMGSAYADSNACATCHPKAFATWQQSGHARAFASLVSKDSDADPSCISCHAVGFGEAGGYRRSMDGKMLVNVGCESCHGPGGEHVRLHTAALSASPPTQVLLKMRPVGAGQCMQCHHGEFSRPFKWEDFWPLIAHGKE